MNNRVIKTIIECCRRIYGFDLKTWLRKDVRLVDIPLNEAKDFILGFVKDGEWTVLEEKETPGFFSLKIQNKRHTLHTGKPQIVLWNVSKEDALIRIETSFDLTEKSADSITQLWGMLNGALFLSLFILYHIGKINAHLTFSELSWFCLLFAPFLIGLSFYSIRLISASQYLEFKNSFYSGISNLIGKKETVLSEGINFPAMPEVFLSLSLVLLQFVIFIFMSAKSGSGFISSLEKPALLFLLLCFVMLWLILFKPRAGIRVSICLTGLIAGSVLSVYCLIPFFSTFIFSFTSKIRIALESSVSRAEILQMPYGTMSEGIRGNFLAATIIYGLLLAVVIIFFWLLLQLPSWLIKKRQWLRTANKKSQFYHSLGSGAEFRIFNFSVIALWLLCLIAIVPGIYFALSNLELALLGKSHFLGNIFTQLMAKNVAIMAEYISFKHNVAIPVSFVSRVMLFLYAIPIIAIIAVIVFRKIKETTGILLARISDLRQKEQLHNIVKSISSYAGVRTPVIAVKNSNLIAGFAVGLLPFCNAIVLTRKAVESLKEDELEALVAHEIAHLKRHSFVFGFLNFLSEWTLFGKGFLAVLLDTKRIEFEADDFSLEWLRRKGFSKEAMVSLLNKTMAINAMSRYLAVSRPLFAFDETGNEDMGGDKMTFGKKLSLLYEVYFGDFMISYIHPSIEERIRRIEAHA